MRVKYEIECYYCEFENKRDYKGSHYPSTTLCDNCGKRFVLLAAIVCQVIKVINTIPMGLTPSEIVDVEESLTEIAEGRAKKFRSVEEFLKDLKIVRNDCPNASL